MTLKEFEKVAEDHKMKLVKYAETWLKNEAEAQDIVQDTLEELLRKKSYLWYDPRKASGTRNRCASPVTWLCECIKYRCKAHLRTKARRGYLEAIQGTPQQEIQEETLEANAQDEYAEFHTSNKEKVSDESATLGPVEEVRLERKPYTSETLYNPEDYGEHEAGEGDTDSRFAPQSAKDGSRRGMVTNEAVDKRPACHCVQIDVRRTLETLDPELREVVGLYHMGRPTTMGRVARQLRWTLRTVQIRLDKAEALLKKDLTRRGFQDPFSC